MEAILGLACERTVRKERVSSGRDARNETIQRESERERVGWKEKKEQKQRKLRASMVDFDLRLPHGQIKCQRKQNSGKKLEERSAWQVKVSMLCLDAMKFPLE